MATRAGGVDGVHVAAGAGTVVVVSPRRSRPRPTEEAEEEKRKERKDKKVAAILHESVPVRFWDHDLGPDRPRLFAGALADEDEPAPTRGSS